MPMITPIRGCKPWCVVGLFRWKLRDLPEALTGVANDGSSSLTVSSRGPRDLPYHPTFKRLFANREAMAKGKKPLDWGAAEALAFATILTDGAGVDSVGRTAVVAPSVTVMQSFMTIMMAVPTCPSSTIERSGALEVIDSPHRRRLSRL